MAADGRSTEPARRPLSPAERLACAGAIAVAASTLLPWYGIPFGDGLSVTGLDSFGFGEAAVLLTVSAAVALIIREAAGHVLPRPLRAAELVMLAGAWAAVLCLYLVFDRPDELGGTTDVTPRLGVFVALGGSAVIALGGMRMRTERLGR
jgi:hypothetical protein